MYASTTARNRAAVLALACLTATAATTTQAAGTCNARSAATITPVVELYTSEGCSSCPPADLWLSRLKAEPNVVALAFHVDYWDRLGWKDRFASPAYTQRQSQTQASSGARFSYTPQVLFDGADRPDWPSLSVAGSKRNRSAAPVDVTLTRDGAHFSASIKALPGAPMRLAAYWAVTEQGHVSAVKAGENSGVTLKHDYVVREYRPVAAWQASADAPVALQFDAAAPADAQYPREVNLVVVNADTGRPVQALKIGC